MASSKLLVSKHVCNRHMTNHCSKQIWSLISNSCDQSTSIRSSFNDQMAMVCEFFSNQKLSSSNKIIEGILSFIFYSCLVPALSKLTATSDTSYNMNSVHIIHKKHRVWVKPRLSGLPKTSISVEFCQDGLVWSCIQRWKD